MIVARYAHDCLSGNDKLFTIYTVVLLVAHDILQTKFMFRQTIYERDRGMFPLACKIKE